MTPTRSNLNVQSCSPISSNCVIWEGENIDCINLCKGDTVSDVVYRLALELCNLKTLLDLTDVDLSCIVDECEDCPEPGESLASVLQVMIAQICEVRESIPEIPDASEELTTAIAACFVENDDNDDPITTLPLSDYVRKIGNQVCTLKTTVASHSTTLDDHEDRIEALEEQEPPSTTIPKIIPTCTFEDTTPRFIDEVVEELEEQFCEVKGALGSAVNLSQAVSIQCQGLKDEAALASTGNMSGFADWVNTPTTVADTLTNMWLTICDIRTALKNIADCCKPVCSSVIIDFTVAVNEDRDGFTMFFNGLTTIPDGWSECSQAGSLLTITDSAGNKYITNVDVVENAEEVDGVDIDLSGTTINTNLTYTIVLDACVIKNGVQCNKTITKTDTPPCGIATSVVATLV